MKRLITVIALMSLLGILCALDIENSGEFRTRTKAIYDDSSESLDDYIDSRLRLNFDGTIADNLSFRAGLEIADSLWGDPWSSPLHVKANEAYIDYHSDFLKADFTVGKQYWADHRSLVFDDFFTGARIKLDEMAGLTTDLIFMKHPLLSQTSTWYIANVASESMLPVPFGFTGMIGNVDDKDLESVSVMPYATAAVGPLTLDITPFADYQYRREEFGFGAAIKADATLDKLTLGGDLLFAAKNGLTTVSPWYMNGLYIYGLGLHHDGIDLYWSSPYEHNSKTFVSIVGKAKYAVTDRLGVFGAAGLLTKTGIEGNAGVEYQVIPDIMSLNGFAALGINDNDRTDLATGASVEVNF